MQNAKILVADCFGLFAFCILNFEFASTIAAVAELTTIEATADDAGRRLDQFLVSQLPDLSRARVQELIAAGHVRVNGAPAKPSLKLKGNEEIEITTTAARPPLRAIAEDIPLDVVYEDDDLAIVNKPAGMMVHAGAGATDDERNRGTLVNALLHRFAALSESGGEMRPGIVHRLDKATSGLIVVAKNDLAHRRLAEQFSSREVHKTYLALVHGWPKREMGTIDAVISRDAIRRTRMTTRRREGRSAVSHYRVLRKLDSPYGKFALLEVKIETGRTHQIRVHLSSIGHPVVGDTLYGAPRELKATRRAGAAAAEAQSLTLSRNFLHAAAIELQQPTSSAQLKFQRPLPDELQAFLRRLEGGSEPV
jgi:23S rRNA pseudouridine1911/1915/1917 synthase